MKITVEIDGLAEAHRVYADLRDFFRDRVSPDELKRLRAALRGPTEHLADALGSDGVDSHQREDRDMAALKKDHAHSQALNDLEAQVTKTQGVLQSALVFVQGIPALIQTAVDAAMANGATAAELAPVKALGDDMGAKADALAAAIANPTP